MRPSHHQIDRQSLRIKAKSILNELQGCKVMIINRRTQLALRRELRKKSKESDCIHIMGALPDSQDPSQMWMFSANNKFSSRYQILNVQTNTYIDTEGEEVKLEKLSEKITQKIEPEEVEKHGKLLFRLKDANNYYMTLDGILTLTAKEKEEEDFQLFEFVAVGGTGRKPVAAYVIYDAQDNFITLLKNKQVGLTGRSSSAKQKWFLEPALDLKDLQQCYSIRNSSNQMFLAPGPSDNLLLQTEDSSGIWRFEKGDKDFQFYIYCVPHQKYLEKGHGDCLCLSENPASKWYPMAQI